MINFCLTVEDREERNKVANAIISVMGQLNPDLRDTEDYTHKLWAHLFIMSNFELDVDCPYPKPSAETFQEKPERIPYPHNKIRYGHYGKTVERLIEAASSYEEGEEKDELTLQIANLMKRSYLAYNRDTVDDQVIVDQLYSLSSGNLKIQDPANLVSTYEVLKSIKANNQNWGSKKKSNNKKRPNPKKKKRH